MSKMWERARSWWRDRSLTLVLMALFVVCTAGQMLTGWLEYNDGQVSHRQAVVSFAGYLATGHPWEALFENWESEFLQMAAFVLLTTRLVQKGSPESRRRGVLESFDADPRDHRDTPGAPWPVRRGGQFWSDSNHRPERWGVVQFSEAVAGSRLVPFVEDRNDLVKWALRRLYYRQRAYRATHGRFATDLAALRADEVRIDGLTFTPTLHATPSMFEVTAPGVDGAVVHLAQDGRVWTTRAAPAVRP